MTNKMPDKSLFFLCFYLFLLPAGSLFPSAIAQARNTRAVTAASYNERGNEWSAKGEYRRAEADFSQYLALKPQHADAYCLRGITRLRQERTDDAGRDFAECLRLNPGLRQSLERMVNEAKQQIRHADDAETAHR
ncbi:MAG: tetratricopeptide repeat protein [Blastocatellia bacterium]